MDFFSVPRPSFLGVSDAFVIEPCPSLWPMTLPFTRWSVCMKISIQGSELSGLRRYLVELVIIHKEAQWDQRCCKTNRNDEENV